MRISRTFYLLIVMALVLLTAACSAPTAWQTPLSLDTPIVVAFINPDTTGGLEALHANTGQLIWKT